jgi:hypothetical protein
MMALPPGLLAGGSQSTGGQPLMRSVLSLLGGMAVSAAGILIVLSSAADLAGVLLIAAGVIVAILGPRHTSPLPDA